MSSGNFIRNVIDAAVSHERRYRFSEHGQSTVFIDRRPQAALARRSTGARDSNPYVPASPERFDIASFVKPERLMSTFRILEAEGGHGAGEDELTYHDFSPGELFSALRQVSEAILDQSYLLYPTRKAEIPKGGGKVRQLHLQRITDRIVAKALQIALDTYWRTQLPRLGKSVHHVFAEMQHAIRKHKAYWLAVDDIKNCFPSAPIRQVIECHQQHITSPDLRWLIETVIRGHEGPGRLTGLDQGSPYSPVAMELLLHHRLDTRLETRWKGLPLLFRYVDNLNIVCCNERECHKALQATKDLLIPLGLHLKGEDGAPQDLRAGFDRKVLGLIPGWSNGQLTFQIPGSGFTDLQEGLIESLRTRCPSETAVSVVKGWLDATGPALTNAVKKRVVDRVIEIAVRCGFTELHRKDLEAVAKEARRKWVVLCERMDRNSRD